MNRASDTAPTEMLISPEVLAERLGSPGVRVIDCTTWMRPNPVGASTMTSAREHWERSHIPGSIHWDLVADYSQPNAPWPFTRPDGHHLAKLLGRSGIRPGDQIVLYGARHPNLVTRAWWVLHSMGLDQISVLDGGFEAWLSKGLPLDADVACWPESSWTPATFRSRGYADMSVVTAASEAGTPMLINALSARQFAGDTAEPHYGRPGHIPRSVSLPAAAMQNGGRYISESHVEALALAAGIPPERDTPLLVYCGGGLAASMVYFNLMRAGWTHLSLYDNSLLEWSAQADLPLQCLV